MTTIFTLGGIFVVVGILIYVSLLNRRKKNKKSTINFSTDFYEELKYFK